MSTAMWLLLQRGVPADVMIATSKPINRIHITNTYCVTANPCSVFARATVLSNCRTKLSPETLDFLVYKSLH